MGQNFDLLGYPKIGIFETIKKCRQRSLKELSNGKKWSILKNFQTSLAKLIMEIVEINKYKVNWGLVILTAYWVRIINQGKIQKNILYQKIFKKIRSPRPDENLFVNKNAIKWKFGIKLQKVGMSPNCWDKSWDFQHFSWEIRSLASSNTGRQPVGKGLEIRQCVFQCY